MFKTFPLSWLATLGAALHNMIAKLHTVVAKVHIVTREVGGSSKILAASSNELSAGTDKQSRSVENISQAMNAMNGIIKDNTERADRTQDTMGLFTTGETERD